MLTIDGKDYTLTLSPEGLKLTEKGKRLGQQLAWKDLISGEAALATALNASLRTATALIEPQRCVRTHFDNLLSFACPSPRSMSSWNALLASALNGLPIPSFGRQPSA